MSPVTASSACRVGSTAESSRRRASRAAQPASRLGARPRPRTRVERLLERCASLEPHLPLGERPRREVHVRVVEAGHDAAAAEVDASRGCERRLVDADAAGDAVARDRERPRHRQRRVERADRRRSRGSRAVAYGRCVAGRLDDPDHDLGPDRPLADPRRDLRLVLAPPARHLASGRGRRPRRCCRRGRARRRRSSPRGTPALAGRAVVAVAGRGRRRVERVDGRLVGRREREMDVLGRLRAVDERERAACRRRTCVRSGRSIASSSAGDGAIAS